MIKSCFLCVDGRPLADYQCLRSNSSLRFKVKSLLKEVNLSSKVEQIVKFDSHSRSENLFYYRFIGEQDIVFIFDIRENKLSLEVLDSIIQECVRAIILKYSTEKQNGTLNSNFTYLLRNIIQRNKKQEPREVPPPQTQMKFLEVCIEESLQLIIGNRDEEGFP